MSFSQFFSGGVSLFDTPTLINCLQTSQKEAVMAKNKVQFQQGVSIQEFMAQYGSEEQCYQALWDLRWPNGFKCPECGHNRYCKLKSRKLMQCNKCRSQISVTARTIFDSTKLPLNTWFLGIYLITQSKVSVSALSLKRNLGVSYNTALLMKHKIQQVMKEQDDSKPISATIVQLDDAYWGGKKRDGRRGRGATGKIPFVAAVSTNADGHPIEMRFSHLPSFSKNAITDWASKHLRGSAKVITDGLLGFEGLGNVGFSHKAIVTGGGPESVKIAEFKWVNTVIANVKRALHGTFHAVSKKHFSRYLAEFCYRFNRRFDLRQLTPRFVYVALRTPPMPQKLLNVAEHCG
jgi:transposase-like protein